MADSFNEKHPTKEEIIAAIATFFFVLAAVVALYFGGVTYDKALLAAASMPEPMEDEEMFLDPELIHDAGEDLSRFDDEPAPLQKGVEEAGDAPEPPAEAQTSVASAKPSETKMKRSDNPAPNPVKTENTREKQEKDALAANMRKGFNQGGAASGAGGEGVGVNGNAPGRRFISCPQPDVALREKTIVKVDVTVNADGLVISAKARSGGTSAIRKACENAARGAKWSPKKGAADTPGTITFTITPK